ncbi:hypothetical protein [Streptomyces agglomeratus]|uniref:hypothetical protein n=1 Tax=Streptomyces agglomeratus TaxID=285458 RepID=UPI003CC8072A
MTFKARNEATVVSPGRRAVAVAITVQWIGTSWTKHSRGGDAAASRNATPTGFAVSPVPPSLAQVIQMSERDGFEPHESERDLREVGLSLQDEGDQLRVLARVEPLSACRRARVALRRCVFAPGSGFGGS